MPSFQHAVRGVAAAAALATGATAGVAAAADHGHGRPEAKHVHRVHHHRGHGHTRSNTHHHERSKPWRRFEPAPWWVVTHHRHKPTYTTSTPTPTTSTPTPTTSTPTPTTTTPTPTTTTPTPTPTPSSPQPVGDPGNWNLTFDDEFNGSSINTNVWNNHDGWTNQNNVTDHAYNVTESGGVATLTLASNGSGATIGTNQNVLAVGDFAEARVEFAGSGTTIYNWPAWWASGPNWPSAGENDIAEGLGTLTVNYHSPSGSHNQGTIPGNWAGAFHTYGIYRGSNYCNVYWDGQLVKHYSTDDNGQAQELLFTMGQANTLQFGAAGQMKVDYVRVWSPA